MESRIFLKKSYESIEQELEDAKIKYLIGNNGAIRDEEFAHN